MAGAGVGRRRVRVEDENAGEDQRVKGLTCPAKESESLLDLEKREQTQSSYVGGQADKTWQLMGYEEEEKREE